MHDSDIKAPSPRQSLAAVIVVLVLAGVIISRDGAPNKARAEITAALQKQQYIEQSKASSEDNELSEVEEYPTY